MKTGFIKKSFHGFRRTLAKNWLEVNSQLKIVGVTGSYGKTTTVTAISKVLSSEFSVNKTDTNLDTVYNLPITILKTKIWNNILVMEYGVDHVNEMDFHLSLVKPDVAVLTGITPVHADSEHLGSLERVIAEKARLVNALPEDGLAVFNYDDPNARKIGESHKGRKVFYGISKNAQIRAEKASFLPTATKFTLKEGKESFEVETGLLGYPAVYACLCAYAVGREFKLSPQKISRELSGLRPLSGRFSVEKGPLGSVLVNDAKRANPASTIAGLKSVSEFAGRKIAVLGEMGELGRYEEEMHRLVGKELARLKIDILVGVGPLTKFITEEAGKEGLKKENIYWAKDVKEAAGILRKIIKNGDVLYLKASLLRHLERIIYILEGRKVGCEKTVCHNYQPCSSCSKLN
jgi:UDP-N-acetylmuramoyl-tripeptide--D-alanyl-D-alanine ligase